MVYLGKFALFSVLLITLACVSQGFAQGLRPNLELGMSKAQVQARWGAPKTVVDKELVKESVWTFGSSEKFIEQVLVFKSNKLSLIDGHLAVPLLVSKKDTNLGDQVTTKGKAFMPVANQEALTEILNEVPSGEDGAKSEAQSPAKFN